MSLVNVIDVRKYVIHVVKWQIMNNINEKISCKISWDFVVNGT